LIRAGFQEGDRGVFEHHALGDAKLPAHVAWRP
jgi:hypothetical protein